MHNTPNIKLYHNPDDDPESPTPLPVPQETAGERIGKAAATLIIGLLFASGIVAALGVFALACHFLKFALIG